MGMAFGKNEKAVSVSVSNKKEDYVYTSVISYGTIITGVSVGVLVGEYLGSFVTTHFNIIDSGDIIMYKAVVKVLLSLGLFFVGRKTNGILRLFLTGASAGSLASVVGDILGQYVVE